MGIWIGDLLRCYDGTSYEVGAFLDCGESREGGGTLYTACLLPMLGDPTNPEDWITVPLIVAGDVVLCLYYCRAIRTRTGSISPSTDGWRWRPGRRA